MTSTVTIGMPVYNGAEYLEEAVRSVLSQTEKDFILHISDNCSDDDTPAICARLLAEDPRIHYVRQDGNLGAAGNFNYLLQHARSPFFKWASHDDLLKPDFLASSLGLLRQAPDAVACSVGVQIIDNTGAQLRTVLPSPELDNSNAVHRARSTGGYQRMVFYGLMRRRALPANAHVDDIFGADDAFVFAMALKNRIVTTDEVLLTYRVVDIAAKQRGLDAHLYIAVQTPNQMFTTMKADIARASLRPAEKARLRLHVRHRRLVAAYQIFVSRNIAGIHRAVAARRYGVLGLRLLVQVLVSPRLVVAQTRRRISGLKRR